MFHQHCLVLIRRRLFLLLLVLVLVPTNSFVLSMSTNHGDLPVQGMPLQTSVGQEERLVVVTGGSRGIGRATSMLLASKGYHVAIADVLPAESVVEEIKEMNHDGEGKIMSFVVDISQEDQVSKMFDDVASAFGMVPYGLVNNAGVMEKMEKDITKIDRATLDRDLAVNAYGPFFCIKEFVRRAGTGVSREGGGGKGGVIVNVSSVSAESGQPLAYAMSKGAQESLMIGLSKMLPVHEGIRINTVVPGLIDTPMAPEGQAERLAPYIPMRRAGQANELAEGIAFLLSDASSYCSGAKLKISGGM